MTSRKRFRVIPSPEKILLTEPEAAFILDVQPASLAVFRCTGRHKIPFLKIGRNVRYRRSDLENWLLSRTHVTGITGGQTCSKKGSKGLDVMGEES
jgi:hypothetical protein